MIQVVVRLKSIQTLEKTVKGKDGKEFPMAKRSEIQQKELLEYMVLQKIILQRVEKPWMVWGTIPETKAEDVVGEGTIIGSPAISKP